MQIIYGRDRFSQSDTTEKGKIHQLHSNPQIKGQMYQEFHIINHTDHNIVLVNADNHISVLPGQFRGNPNDRRIIIRRRQVLGPRTIDNRNFDISECHIINRVIPYSVVKEGPILDEITGYLICRSGDESLVKHPYNKEQLEQALSTKPLHYIESGNMAYPISVYANDPSGYITKLYTVINDKVYTIKVTNFKDCDDSFNLVLRDTYSNGDYKPIKFNTTFSKLLKENKNLWNIEDMYFSSSKEFLDSHIETIKNKLAANTIAASEHKDMVEQLMQLHEERLNALNERVASLQRINKLQKETIAGLKDNSIGKDAVDVEKMKIKLNRREIELQSNKLQHETNRYYIDMAYDIRNRRVAANQEMTKDIATYLKSAAVIIPAALGIMKLLSA